MRGKPTASVYLVAADRNIPAYAGKTGSTQLADYFTEEHPRVCGENQNAWPTNSLSPGTSPRMRGKQQDRPYGPAKLRNIPAYAGKTVSQQLQQR